MRLIRASAGRMRGGYVHEGVRVLPLRERQRGGVPYASPYPSHARN
jgi:hypothetical protein